MYADKLKIKADEKFSAEEWCIVKTWRRKKQKMAAAEVIGSSAEEDAAAAKNKKNNPLKLKSANWQTKVKTTIIEHL